jgi:hypothetical protein
MTIYIYVMSERSTSERAREKEKNAKYSSSGSRGNHENDYLILLSSDVESFKAKTFHHHACRHATTQNAKLIHAL